MELRRGRWDDQSEIYKLTKFLFVDINWDYRWKWDNLRNNIYTHTHSHTHIQSDNIKKPKKKFFESQYFMGNKRNIQRDSLKVERLKECLVRKANWKWHFRKYVLNSQKKKRWKLFICVLLIIFSNLHLLRKQMS